jgi:hypothetical protein
MKGIRMVDTTDIEKKSLEAHVELCAERYRYLEEKLNTLEDKTDKTNVMVTEIKGMVQTVVNKRNDQLISWGLGIIVALGSVIGWLVTHYIIK